MTFLYYPLLILFIVLALFLMLLVLIQKGRGGGLSAAFGGVGGNTAFGAKTGDVLTWATSIVFGVFLLLAIGLNLIANSVHADATKLTIDEPTTRPITQNPGASAEETAPVVVPPGATPATPPASAPAATPSGLAPSGTTPSMGAPALTPPASNPTTSPSTRPTAQ